MNYWIRLAVARPTIEYVWPSSRFQVKLTLNFPVLLKTFVLFENFEFWNRWNDNSLTWDLELANWRRSTLLQSWNLEIVKYNSWNSSTIEYARPVHVNFSKIIALNHNVALKESMNYWIRLAVSRPTIEHEGKKFNELLNTSGRRTSNYWIRLAVTRRTIEYVWPPTDQDWL